MNTRVLMRQLNAWLRRKAWAWLTHGATTGAMQIGLGGAGLDPAIPECSCCYAYGGGGHGGFCPNAGGKPRAQWVTEPPEGVTRPRRPADWHPTAGRSAGGRSQ